MSPIWRLEKDGVANLVAVPLSVWKRQRPLLDFYTSTVPLSFSDSFVLLYVCRKKCLRDRGYLLLLRFPQMLQKSRRHLKILGARMVIRSEFRTGDPQLLGATVQNIVALATWRHWICIPLFLTYGLTIIVSIGSGALEVPS
jgi:hypothetical protein